MNTFIRYKIISLPPAKPLFTFNRSISYCIDAYFSGHNSISKTISFFLNSLSSFVNSEENVKSLHEFLDIFQHAMSSQELIEVLESCKPLITFPKSFYQHLDNQYRLQQGVLNLEFNVDKTTFARKMPGLLFYRMLSVAEPDRVQENEAIIRFNLMYRHKFDTTAMTTLLQNAANLQLTSMPLIDVVRFRHSVGGHRMAMTIDLSSPPHAATFLKNLRSIGVFPKMKMKPYFDHVKKSLQGIEDGFKITLINTDPSLKHADMRSYHFTELSSSNERDVSKDVFRRFGLNYHRSYALQVSLDCTYRCLPWADALSRKDQGEPLKLTTLATDNIMNAKRSKDLVDTESLSYLFYNIDFYDNELGLKLKADKAFHDICLKFSNQQLQVGHQKMNSKEIVSILDQLIQNPSMSMLQSQWILHTLYDFCDFKHYPDLKLQFDLVLGFFTGRNFNISEFNQKSPTQKSFVLGDRLSPYLHFTRRVRYGKELLKVGVPRSKIKHRFRIRKFTGVQALVLLKDAFQKYLKTIENPSFDQHTEI